MRLEEAIALLRPAGVQPGGAWADLGAGEGLFTRALAVLLGREGRVLAVERDPEALRALSVLEREAAPDRAPVRAVEGDFRDLASLGELARVSLDGALFANALHFAPDPEEVLEQAVLRLRAGGQVIVVEYDGRPASRWIPHPLPPDRLSAVAARLGLQPPEVVGERPSAYGGTMYCAALRRPMA